MKSISWIEISKKRYGGFAYNEQARVALAQDFDVELVGAQPRVLKMFRPLKFAEVLIRLMRLRGDSSVWVRNFYAVLTMPLDNTKGRQIAVRHHVDFSGFPRLSRPLFFLLEKVFDRQAKKLDALVVVSRYWKRHFEEKGFQNVHVIYNGFDVKRFEVSESHIADFRKRHGLKNKPVVYLGNCQKPKGVQEAWEALKDVDVHLVTSGERMVNIPAKNFKLPYEEYLCLLASSSVALAMSRFQEGWSRTAHEAMLLKVPVVGSGFGGMRELLEGGGQIICEDFSNLKKVVEYLLLDPKERERLGEQGYAFAKKFSIERFEEEWLRLIRMLL
jgi:glycosyltransferase involved in cell wall biosynthesis